MPLFTNWAYGAFATTRPTIFGHCPSISVSTECFNRPGTIWMALDFGWIGFGFDTGDRANTSDATSDSCRCNHKRVGGSNAARNAARSIVKVSLADTPGCYPGVDVVMVPSTGVSPFHQDGGRSPCID